MANAQIPRRALRYLMMCAALLAAPFVHSSACAAQTAKESEPPATQWFEEVRKNPELVAALNKLSERLQHEIHVPPPRSESLLLPLVPDTTVFYSAMPNYGEALHQALDIFREERQQNTALREWLQKGAANTVLPATETWIEKGYQFLGYLGDEIVVSASMEGKEPKLLIVAQVRKPGLKNFLQPVMGELSTKTKARIRILGPEELATAERPSGPDEFIVLVRPDLVAGATDLEVLRSFNARMDKNRREFASTAFGQRVARAYQGGVTGVGAVDLGKILSLFPPSNEKERMVFQRTGFADMEYLVWDRRKKEGQTVSEGELSFTRPRHGVASWLAGPGEMSSLDFVWPKAMLVTAFRLKKPVEIFNDVKEMSDIESPQAFAGVAQFEQAMNISLKDDLLALLTGELALELDDFSKEKIDWKAFLRVSDPEHLQKTIATLLAAGKMEAEQAEEGGIKYFRVRVPSGKKPFEIDYAFADGQLIAGSSRESVTQAIQMHRSGGSLAKDEKFLAALPAGHPTGVSAVFYQEPISFVTAVMRQAAPEMAASLMQLSGARAPKVGTLYGEESAIREEGTSPAFDAGIVMVVAAIAIPNVLRSRIAANEAGAVGSLRVINTAEVTYFATYAEKGYAPDLAKLGPNPDGSQTNTAEHAGLLDSSLANPSCTGSTWCTKGGFRFIIKANCKGGHCDDYVAVASPFSSDTGYRNFCSTSDGVIRFQQGPPLEAPVTIEECRGWTPVQ
jgi:hypothetical protein